VTATGALADYAGSIGSDGDYWCSTPTSARGAFRVYHDMCGTGRKARLGYTFGDFSDGLSNVLLVGEKHVPITRFGIDAGDTGAYNGDKGGSLRPLNAGRTLARSAQEVPANPIFGSYHAGFCNFVFGDGSVRALRNTLDATTLSRLADRSDGNTVTYD
jgi:prepilin-type processing-associated H-X9-DG protein